MRLLALAAAASCALLMPIGASAQTPPPTPVLTVGTVVYDPQGAEVGKIGGISGEVITLDTGTHKVGLPKSAFGAGTKGPSITVTKAQIEAQVAAALAQSAAELQAALVPGAEVRGKSGAIIGTVKEIKGDQIVVDRPAGPISLAKNVFVKTPQGLTLPITAAEIDAAAKAAAGS